MEQFSFAIVATLPLFCLSLLLLFRRPLYAAIYLLIYRSIFSVAAYLHIAGIGSVPFFVPGFLTLWLVLALYHGFVRTRFAPIIPIFSLLVVGAAMIGSSALFTVFRPERGGDLAAMTLKFILPVAVYLAAWAGLETPDDFRRLPRLIAAFLFVPVSVGLWQSVTGRSYDYATDAVVAGMRPVGTIIDPNAYGIFLCMSAFLVAPHALRKGHPGMKALLLTLVLAILLARNRGSWICAMVATGCGIALFRRYFNMTKVLGLATAAALFAAPIVVARFGELGGTDRFGQSQDTFSERIEQSRHLLDEAGKAPLAGYGAGTAEQPWGSSTIARPPHDDYVRMVYEYGIPVALLYVLFLFDQLQIAVRLRNRENWIYGFSATCFMIYVILISMVQNLIYDSIMYSTVMLMMAIMHRSRYVIPGPICSGVDGREVVSAYGPARHARSARQTPAP